MSFRLSSSLSNYRRIIRFIHVLAKTWPFLLIASHEGRPTFCSQSHWLLFVLTDDVAIFGPPGKLEKSFKLFFQPQPFRIHVYIRVHHSLLINDSKDLSYVLRKVLQNLARV